MAASASSAERSADEIRQLVLDEAQKLADEDVAINKRMAEHGAALSTTAIRSSITATRARSPQSIGELRWA
jgi:methylthioribose-1-phosphate isomerase